MNLSPAEIQSTVYGPVPSWRFGRSLGIDPILHGSFCSFNCLYCQLGQIQHVTVSRQVFVETERILSDLRQAVSVHGDAFDVMTISGTGEPTLAANLDQIIEGIRSMGLSQQLCILTNSTLLHDPDVQQALRPIDRVIAKLDAIDDQSMKYINRPAASVSAQQIVQNLIGFRRVYDGQLDIQSMFMSLPTPEYLEQYIQIINQIRPQRVHLNTPTRHYPSQWDYENRGKHINERPYRTTELRRLTPEQATLLESDLRRGLSDDIEISSVYAA